MSVYIEYVFIDNFVLTFAISLVSYRVLKLSLARRRVICCAIVGSLVSLFYPLLNIGIVSLFLLRLSLLALLSFILFYKKSKLLISSLVFLGITFLFGGAFFALGYLIHGDVVSALTLPLFDFPIGLVILVSFFIYIIFRRLSTKLHKTRDYKSNIFKVELEVLDKRICTEGFYDSGNRVYDSKSGLPVVVLSFGLTSRILDSDALIKLLSDRGEDSYSSARSIEVTPYASRPIKLWLIKPQKFLLYFGAKKNIHIEVMLGLSINSFSDKCSHDLIFGSGVLSRL